MITGSYNWTSAGAESNDENTLIIHDAATAQAYYQEYLRLYQAIPPDAVCSRHSAESGMPACQDGIDNDYDNLIDAADANCRESTPALCLDGLDNDGDGKVDTADLDCYRCRLGATGISGGTTVAAGQPLALTLQLDPAQGPLTYAWSDQGATTPDRDLRLAHAGQVHGDGQRDQLVPHGERQSGGDGHGRAGEDLAAGDQPWGRVTQ